MGLGEEANRKEIEIKKRLLEDPLLSFSKGSSRDSFRSRRSITFILQMLPTQEAVEKWMQVRDQDVNVNKNLDLESCVIVPVNEMKSLTQEVFLPLQNRQSSLFASRK